jgi:hypothetical protein
MKEKSPRTKFVAQLDLRKFASILWNTMIQASHHDPDHAKELEKLSSRLDVVEHQLWRLGAPQYRTVYKGKNKSAPPDRDSK